MYTSFQAARCFYTNAWDNKLGYIDAHYGLDERDRAATSTHIWNGVRERLVSRVAEYTKRAQEHYYRPFLDLVAGEAADTPAFLEMVRQVAKEIPRVRVARADRDRGGNDKRSEVELLVSEDPAFAAARGAAFGLEMRTNGTYCDEFYDSGELVDQRTLVRDGHVEL